MAVNATTPVYAVGTLTLTGQPLATETVVIGGVTYTFQATLTDVDGNVHIGADAAGSISNLAAAINLSNEGETAVSAGTDYADSQTVDPDVRATAFTATTLVITARSPGTAGNYINSTETLTNGSWGAATLASGAGNVDAYMESILSPLNQVNSELWQYLAPLTIDAGD